jgi:hypothetical protein
MQVGRDDRLFTRGYRRDPHTGDPQTVDVGDLMDRLTFAGTQVRKSPANYGHLEMPIQMLGM